MKKLFRNALVGLVAVVGAIGVVAVILVLVFRPWGRLPPRDPLTPFVKADKLWTAEDFQQFLDHCDADRLGVLEKSLDLNVGGGGTASRVQAVKKRLVWESSHIATYPFKDTNSVNYHQVVQWVAAKHGVPATRVNSESTFILERLIFEQVFKDMWDRLKPEQRRELLKRIDTRGQLDTATIATLGGTAALATLATTVYFAGFAFYATMSTVIATVAGVFGVAVPFGTYMGASGVVAFLSGPVGWALVAIGAAGSLALLGRADLKSTTAFVVQMHCLKVAALQNSGSKIPDPKR
jgi:uncharacterized protein YaaW (UPF0174 family)